MTLSINITAQSKAEAEQLFTEKASELDAATAAAAASALTGQLALLDDNPDMNVQVVVNVSSNVQVFDDSQKVFGAAISVSVGLANRT